MSEELAQLAKRIKLLADIPRVQAELRPDKVAMTFEGRSTTYKELNDRASQQANAFLREELKPQARVAMLAKNTDMFFELQFATVKSRVVLVPGDVVAFLTLETAATLAKIQIDEIAGFAAALRYALALMAARGERESVKKDHYALAAPARARFDRAADQLFFPNLWRRLSAVSVSDDAVADAKYAFLADLLKAAQAELDTAVPAIPCTAIYRPRAEARARRAFHFSVRKHCPDLFGKESSDVAA